MLRRAKQDWPQPEGAGPTAAAPTAGEAPARLFASHYYAADHGFDGLATTEPFPKDLLRAGQFLACLLGPEVHESLIPEYGRQFGRMMRAKHQGDRQAKPILSSALTLFGDEFLQQVQREASTLRQQALGKVKARHQAACFGWNDVCQHTTRGSRRAERPKATRTRR